MKIRFLTLLAACALVTAFTALPAIAAGPVSASDQQFVTAVGQAGATEVKAGKLAESKSSNADVKSYGALMIKQHTELGDELKKLAAQNGFTFPTGIGADNQQTLDSLAAKSGNEFNTAYAAAMVTTHEGAVGLFENASKNAQNAALKRWATKNLPVIQMHLKMAKELQAKLQ
jgi:putative membrane protein